MRQRTYELSSNLIYFKARLTVAYICFIDSLPKESRHEHHLKLVTSYIIISHLGFFGSGNFLAMNKPRRTKIALAVAAGLIAIPVVMLVVLLNFDWNRAKLWLKAHISEMLGRSFAITGDLSLTWEKPVEREEGWRDIIPWPYWVAQDIHIGNPSNMKALMPAEMASIKQLAFSLNPL